MKFLFLIAFIIAFNGCSNNPTTFTAHELVVNPLSITFPSGVSIKHISITHTCTCPFTWHVIPIDSTPVLQPTNGAWDSTNASVIIDRTKLLTDSLHASFQITSNGYGTDTVQVTVYK